MEQKDSKNLVQEESKEEILKIQPAVTCKKGDHEFYIKSGTEIECYNCPMGFPFGPGTEVKKKHIYIHGSFVI